MIIMVCERIVMYSYICSQCSTLQCWL